MCLYTVTRVYIVYAIDVVLFIPVPCVCTLFRPLIYKPISACILFVCPKVKVYVKKCETDNTL